MLRIEVSAAPRAAQAGACASRRLVLPWELRCRSRLLAPLDDGTDAGLFLERGTVLRGGTLLQATDGTVIEVVAADEALMEVHCSNAGQLTIDLGSLTTFVSAFVQDIQSVTAAPGIKPIVDLFGTKLPLVNKSLGDVAADLKSSAGHNPPIVCGRGANSAAGVGGWGVDKTCARSAGDFPA